MTLSLKGINLTNEKIQQHIFGDILKRSVVLELRYLREVDAPGGAKHRPALLRFRFRWSVPSCRLFGLPWSVCRGSCSVGARP